ncbi:GST C domain containing protein [Trichuris trichiura]|uniref:GST C domain containing protein n=1 Tax=Trichuris trichiura TaxID=36087 RepID=A0A077ZL98_TRITR|nr:GST C domain containing protein [Trichuris trichiura]
MGAAVSSTSSNVPSSSRPEEEQAIDSDAGDAKHRQRRGAVSAEVYSEEDVKNYVKKDDVNSARAMIVAADAVDLMPDECAAFIEVDSWLELADILKGCNNWELGNHLRTLNQRLNGRNALVGSKLSLADYALWASLQSLTTKKENALKSYANVEKFCRNCLSDVLLQKVQEQLSCRPQQKEAKQKTVKDEGKYIELPGAINGQVVVRFPPEASGFGVSSTAPD